MSSQVSCLFEGKVSHHLASYSQTVAATNIIMFFVASCGVVLSCWMKLMTFSFIFFPSGLSFFFVRSDVELHRNSESTPLLIDRVSVLIVLFIYLFIKLSSKRWFQAHRYSLQERLKENQFLPLGHSQRVVMALSSFLKPHLTLFWCCSFCREHIQTATDPFPQSSGWMSADQRPRSSCELDSLAVCTR